LFLSLVFRIINKDIDLTYPNKCTLEEKKLRVCLVGVKIIFVENDFPILRCLAKKEDENYFQRKMIFPHMKENIFL